MADPLFYDALHTEGTAGRPFSVADRPLPVGWLCKEQEDWLVVSPPALELPTQGWKIHISACLDNADRVVTTVWDYCVPRGIEFKFLRSPRVLWLRSSKYAPRGYSGKLVTIYPPDETACESILRELDAALDGESGPYILSDLRWCNGPLYVRYGGFASRYCVNDAGKVVLAIADDAGALVPDRRTPVFHVPPWVTLPDFLAPHLAARNAVTVAELPYTIDSVLHFSNGGGLYLSRDTRTDEQVVLKEGRPFAGLDGAGVDAVARVEREYAMLRRLTGVPGVPEVFDLFSVGEHRFLAMEYVAGKPLRRELVRRSPLIKLNAGPAEYAEYTAWAVDIHRQVEAAVHAVHKRGVVYGDLHLYNIMVRPDGTVALLDFEVASPLEENRQPGLGNPGFTAPSGTRGADVDRYALACLRLALFLPITQLLPLSRAKAAHLAEVIAQRFPVPAGFLAEAVEVICPAAVPPAPRPRLELDAGDWPGTRDRLCRAVLASASPDRLDRLFPGDIEQFSVGGLGLAYGAAGVLYALDVTGAGRYPELEDWLLRRAQQPPSGTLLGLYDGLHGVAFALDHLGHRPVALNLLDMCLSEKWEALGLELMGGLAGIGLNLAHFAERTGDAGLRAAARRAADLVADRLGDADSVPEISGDGNPYAGLFSGSAGPALLLLRAYDDTGDAGYLDRSADALRQDLRRCIVDEDGTMEVNEGWRTMPYLGRGSIGVGMALDQYLARRHDEDFAEASAAISRAAHLPLYVQSDLYAGRAGILLYLAGRSANPRTDPTVLAQLRALSWHALPYADGLAFPGEALLRLSMDLATGTAGVLLALGAALHDRPVHLPLLAPAPAPRPQSPVPAGHGLVSTTL
jgi:hypothetical protein